MDIDVDDPEFWTKWAQKAAIDVKDIDKVNRSGLQFSLSNRKENNFVNYAYST